MRKLSAPRGGERVGAVAFEVAALMSRAAGLWRALGDAQVARLRGEGVRLKGVRRLVADDDAALLALALAEMAGACRDLSLAVARISARCADPLLRRFGALFAALVARGVDPHGLRYDDAAAARRGKMDRKARKMQRLVACTAILSQELDVLAELEQGVRRHDVPGGPGKKNAAAAGDAARRRVVARQRQEVDRLRSASLWNRTFDYVVRLLARSLFTIVARIRQVFSLDPKNAAMDDAAAMAGARLSWSSSFVSSTHSLVYPADSPADTPPRRLLRAKSGKDLGRFLLSRSQSLRQQLKWPTSGKQLIGCMVSVSKPPAMARWVHGEDGDLPLSFSYVSSNNDGSSISSQLQEDHHTNANLSTSVFDSSSHDWLMSSPETTLGAAALALHYANLIIFIEKLSISPQLICPDERDALYSMLTDRMRASLRARLKPFSKTKKMTPLPLPSSSSSRVPAMAAEWADTVQSILGWLAPLAYNMLRWQSERNFEQRNVASATGVLLLQTLHFADQQKSEAAIVELLVGLDYLWRSGTGREDGGAKARLVSAGRGRRRSCGGFTLLQIIEDDVSVAA